MKKEAICLALLLPFASCKQQKPEDTAPKTETPELREVERVQMEQVEGAQFKLVTPDLSKIETWEAPLVSTFPMPTPREGEHELGVQWSAPDLVKTYSLVALCLADDCITQLTLGHMTSYPGYPKAWEGKTASLHVKICADEETAQAHCTPTGTTTVDLKDFPRGDASDAHLETLAKQQKAIHYSRKFYDMLVQYKQLAKDLPDADLTLSHQATDNALSAGRLTLAVSVSRHRDILLSDLRSILPAQTGLALTASRVRNEKWLWVSDYDGFDSARKDKFDYAMAHPQTCGHMRWKTEEGPLVDKYNEEYNKLRMIECIDKIPPKADRERIAAETAREERVQSSTSYVTGSLVLGAGLIVGFISLYAYSPTFRAIWGIHNISEGRYISGAVDIYNSTSASWIKGRTALIGGGVAVGLAIIGITLMAHAEESIRLAQKPKNAANDFLETELQKFFTGLRSLL